MAKALVARDNKLITTRFMAGARVKMVQSGVLTMARDSRLALVARDNNQMLTAARAKARAACLQIMRGQGSLTMVAPMRILAARGRGKAGARVNNQMVTAARAKARAACLQIMRGKGSLTMVARGGPRAHNTANMKC